MKMKLSAKLFCLLMIFIIQNFSIVSLMANDNSIDWEVASESTGTPVSTTSESEKNLDKVFFLINHTDIPIQIQNVDVRDKKLLIGNVESNIANLEGLSVSNDEVLVNAAIGSITFEIELPKGKVLFEAKIPAGMTDGTKLFFEEKDGGFILRSKSSASKSYKISLTSGKKKKSQAELFSIPSMSIPHLSLGSSATDQKTESQKSSE